jgi:class 3 adenylate cyclase
MRDHCLRVLKKAGLSNEAAEQFATLIVAPPPGTFDESELAGADVFRICLLAAIVAATRHWEHGEALVQLLQFTGKRISQMSPYDQGRYWHLKGFAAWRLDGSVYTAMQLLQRSVRRIQESDTPDADAYLPRVLDVLGQLLHHNGQLQDARAEFELAVKYREAINDEPGLALSLGNLGRLCLDVGDFTAALEYLTRDLEIVERISPDMTRLQSQLLTNLATSARHLDRLAEAQDLLDKSEELAQADENIVGLFFVTLGRANIALSQGDISSARQLSDRVLDKLADPSIPESLRNGLAAMGFQLSAEVELARGNVQESLKKFKSSRESFALETTVSPVAVAAMLRGYAKAAQASGDLEHSTLLLREALQRLDSTSADTMRQIVEDDLRKRFRDSWLLHSAGRFIGQDHIEFLLNEAGHSGFRGARKDIAILFADIRGFTSISEHFSPDALIVFLNDFLSFMTRCVQHFDGMVDKFIGDALMALFTLPNPQPDDAESSMKTALMMRSELARFNQRLPEGTPPLDIGIGIHFGSTVAGLIGSPQKRSYTVIGDAVNTASRLEGMTKQLGATILVTEELIRQVANPGRFLLRPLGKYCPKGRANAVTVFDLMDEKEISEHGEELYQEIEQLEGALQLFAEQDFREARSVFGRLAQATEGTLRQNGYDLMAEASDEYSEKPPEDEWDGAITLTSK